MSKQETEFIRDVVAPGLRYIDNVGRNISKVF